MVLAGCFLGSVCLLCGQYLIVYEIKSNLKRIFSSHLFTPPSDLITPLIKIKQPPCFWHPQSVKPKAPRKKINPLPTIPPPAKPSLRHHLRGPAPTSLCPHPGWGAGYQPARGSRFPVGTEKSPLTLRWMPWSGERPLLFGAVRGGERGSERAPG
jgi:hypothetical protein